MPAESTPKSDLYVYTNGQVIHVPGLPEGRAAGIRDALSTVPGSPDAWYRFEHDGRVWRLRYAAVDAVCTAPVARNPWAEPEPPGLEHGEDTA